VSKRWVILTGTGRCMGAGWRNSRYPACQVSCQGSLSLPERGGLPDHPRMNSAPATVIAHLKAKPGWEELPREKLLALIATPALNRLVWMTRCSSNSLRDG
jgi:hypothetical protein